MKRSPQSGPLRWVALLAIGGAVAACRPAPPPPPPPAVAAPAAPGAEPAPPQTFVRVIGSRLNVRQTPAVSAPTVARVQRGERLGVLDATATGCGSPWSMGVPAG